jgi:hypothetical protein
MSERAGIARGTRAAIAVVVGAGALLALPHVAGAQDPAPELGFTGAEASAQLDQAVEALTGGDPSVADPTEELRDLALALPALDGTERRQARAILARPPANDGGVEPFGAEWTAAATATEQTFNTANGFRIHWVTLGGDAPNLANTGGAAAPDYVEDKVAVFADESQMVENGTLGWPESKSDGTRGGGSGLTDIYLADICEPGACIFGYAGPDDNSGQCNTPPFRCFAYLVLDDDYAPEEFEYPNPDIPLSVTMAHEYNHVLQFGIDAAQEAWMFEATAVWSEEHVFPDADDWLFYLDTWKRQPQEPITKFGAGGGLRVYGSAVWNHWLDVGRGYGPDVVLDSWQKSRQSDPKDFGIGAYDLGIKANGGQGFAKEFGRFTAATAEWRAPQFSFPDREEYPDVKREGKLRRGRSAEAFRLDHASYRLIRVAPGSASRLKLSVRAARGVHTGIALVARAGGAETGEVRVKFDYLRRGGREGITLQNAQDFERITAVVTNADGRVRGSNTSDYAHDNERFRATLR